MSLLMFFFSKIVLAIWGLEIPYEFEDEFFHFCKNPVDVFDRDYADSVDHIG